MYCDRNWRVGTSNNAHLLIRLKRCSVQTSCTVVGSRCVRIAALHLFDRVSDLSDKDIEGFIKMFMLNLAFWYPSAPCQSARDQAVNSSTLSEI